MCVVKTPKVKAADTVVKEPTIIRNPYLDGVGPESKALRVGRSRLRIERSTPGAAPAAPGVAPAASTPSASSADQIKQVLATQGFGAAWSQVGAIKKSSSNKDAQRAFVADVFPNGPFGGRTAEQTAVARSKIRARANGIGFK